MRIDVSLSQDSHASARAGSGFGGGARCGANAVLTAAVQADMLGAGTWMKRRTFLSALGSAAACPLPAWSQQSDRMRHLGVLTGSADHTEARSRVDAFLRGLRERGWIEGQNIRITLRWSEDSVRLATMARELVGLKPDAMLVGPTNAVVAAAKETRDIPIVFVNVTDALGQGIVDSLARPLGNITGFSSMEFSVIGKWLDVIKKAAPNVSQIAFMIATSNATFESWHQQLVALAPAFAIEPSVARVRDAADIERAVIALARKGNGALIVANDTMLSSPAIRRLIVDLTAAQRLPAVYGDLAFGAEGGLFSYGTDRADLYRRAADYIDRVLKGEKPSELPVQRPTKFQLIINLKTARALNIEIPPVLAASADEVIE